MTRYTRIACLTLTLLATAGISSAQTTATSPAASPGSAAASAAAGSTAPYTEGSVWDVTMVRAKAGMSDDYLENLSKAWKLTLEEGKKQGFIVDYKVLVGSPANADDFDILLMVEYKNWAAFDNIRAKTDPIAEKITGGQDQQRQASVKRGEIREILGSKTMQEVTLK